MDAQQSPGNSPLRVLVVEDHSDTLASISRLLKRLGYMVLHARCVKEAQAVLEKERLDALLCDIHLPDGNGRELLRSLPPERRPPRVVAMSIYSSPGARERSEAAGFQRYLVKPFSPTELAEALEEEGAPK